VTARKICVVVASRANYGRVKHLLLAIDKHPDLDLQLIVGASALLDRFGDVLSVVREDGFAPDCVLHYVVEGENLLTQAKSTGLGIIELSGAFENMKPDVVVTVADRFETMATAVAASYMNIFIAHLQGGELSGNIDDRVRHAITKLSDVHFVATEQSRDRVIKLGEAPETVFNHGDPAMDVLAGQVLSINNDVMSKYHGVGSAMDWSRPYILVMQHPVTTSYGHGEEEVSEVLEAVSRFPEYQKVVMWPNMDAGSAQVAKGIRVFREEGDTANFSFYKNFSPESYARALNNAVCCVGNSSSFIREGAFLGAPAVIVGNRQNAREQGANIVNAPFDKKEIAAKIAAQVAHGKYDPDKRFGDGHAGERIADALASLPLNIQKAPAHV